MSSANLQKCCKRTWKKVCSKASKKLKTLEKAAEDMSMCSPWLWATLVVPGPRFSPPWTWGESTCSSHWTPRRRPNSSRVFVSLWPRAGHFHMVRTCKQMWCCLASENFSTILNVQPIIAYQDAQHSQPVSCKLHPACAHDTCTAAAMAFQKRGYGGHVKQSPPRPGEFHL